MPIELILQLKKLIKKSIIYNHHLSYKNMKLQVISHDNKYYSKIYSRELFNGNTDDFSTIQLVDNVENYDYLEIYYIGIYTNTSHSKIYKANYGVTALRAMHISGDSNILNCLNTLVNLRGKTVTADRCANYQVTSSGVSNYTKTNQIRIIKIIGFKY